MDIFGDSIFYCGNKRKEIEDKLNEMFTMDDKVRRDKVNKAYKIVCNGHTYTDRLKQIMNVLIHN
jgi:hypothetical protein